MHVAPSHDDKTVVVAPLASWAAVASIGVGAFALVTTEFLPVGLLPQIARDLRISEGQAGLMVTIPGFFAAIAAPLTIGLAGRFDRRNVLWLLLGLLVVSNLLVASATGFGALLAGRVVLGVGIGGFWTIGGSLGPRLRPGPDGPRATSIILSGISLGTVAGVPAGAWLGDALGWRYAFGAAAAIALLVVIALLTLLPQIRPQGGSGLAAVPEVLRRRRTQVGLAGTTLIFVGQFAAYTYITPFLNQVSHIEGATLSVVLLGFGAAGFAGNLFGGWVSAREVRLAFAVMAGLLGGSIALLVLTGANPWAAALAVVAWGFGFGMMPVTIQTFLFSAAPDRLESVSALLTTTIQISLGAGALIGGLVVDHFGVTPALWLGAVAAFFTSALILALGADRKAPARAAISRQLDGAQES